jgi:Cytochrome c554 and c-prime
VEIGNYMQGTGNDRTVKNKWLWQGMEKVGIEVLNVAEDDIAELQAQGVDIKSDRFISANLISTATGQPLLRPYVVKEIPLKDTEKKYRLGFLGLAAREGFVKTEEAGYIWADPLPSAKKWLPELQHKCDFLIVLACMPTKDAVQLAIENSNVDIILTGFKHQASVPPARISQSTLVYVEDEGKILGELRFTRVPGRRVDVQPVNHVLTRNVKDDPEMLAFISQAKAAISTEQRALADAGGTAARPTLSTEGSPFLTSASCAACHEAAYQVWEKSQHAHAIETLKKEKKEFDSACVGCHVTGAGKPGGFVDLNQTAHLANVQCEACHGSGREHIARPTEARMTKLTAASCLSCHTKSNSPEFEFAAYWSKIKH